MAADENSEVQQVSDSDSGNKTFELSSPLKNDFTFICNGLDSFLESLKLDSELKGSEARSVSGACAMRPDPEEPDCPGVPPLPPNRPSPTTSVTPASESSNTKVLLKDYDCPKPIILFNRTIPVSTTQKFTRSIQFTQQRSSQSVDCLAECRFPPTLRSLYQGLNRLESKKRPELTTEQESTPVKTRRRRQRNRLSLSDHAFDNDDAHGRRNLLPTEEDLRTTYDKIYHFRGIRYIFGCSRGKSCESPAKCAPEASSFGLFMEINPKPDTPLHPLVRENINSVLGESCIVDKLSASIAVSAVRSQNAPPNRLFIPVSYHLKDKIGFNDGIVTPEVFPETKIEEPVRGVVADLLDFVDRQMGFVAKFEYDPDFLSSAENSLCEGGSQENVDCSKINSEISTDEREICERRRKRGKCKEQNKVLRELKKLMNISVTDEAVEVVDSGDSKCSEPSCSLGCVCSSVHEKCHPPPEHCGNIGCMFECTCPDRSREMYLNLGDLSKEEKSWHQTVIRKRNNALEIKSGVDRSKRRKKMPSRYENTVTGRMMNRCLEMNLREERKSGEFKELRASSLTKSTRSVSLDNQKVQYNSNRSLKSVKDLNELEEEITQRNAAIAEKIRKSLRDKYQNKLIAHTERRLSLTATEEAKTLFDTFIWCTIHHKYDCNCINWIVFGKENNLVSKPPSFNRFSAEKFLGSVILEKNGGEPRKVVWYDQTKHSVRTAGPYIDYGNRNKDAMFKKKLSYLLEHKIVSFSNSYVKAKPVATFMTENPSDNYPYIPALARKITCGVGDVVKITRDSISNEPVEIGDHMVSFLSDQLYVPPDNLRWESSDEEIVDKSDFSLENDGSEFIPKPKKKILSAKQRFCFSSVFKNKSKCTPKGEDLACVQPKYDSDVELVEDPIETYSVTSSPEPEIVDGGTVSDSSSDDNGYSRANDTSSESKKYGISEGENGNLSSDSIYSVPDDSYSFSSPTKLVIDESVDSSQSPAKSPCVEVDNKNPEIDRRQSKEDEYPPKGLFCMSLPDLGYLKVVDSRPNNFTMEDPCNPQSFKTFNNCKEANEFMKSLVGANPAFATSDWVMVTRGVLEKYQSKPFDQSCVCKKKRKRENNQSQGKSKIVRRDTEKILRAQFDLKVPLDSSHLPGVQGDIFQSSHSLLTDTADKVRTLPGNIKPVVSVPTPSQPVAASSVKNLVGTFPNISEANSFIEKNYQSRVYVRPCTASSTAPTTGTILTAGTNQISGKFVHLPVLSGPRVRGGVPPNKSVRTVLVRGAIARQPTTRPVIHIRPNFTVSKVSGGVPQTPTVGSVVSTTNAGVSKTQVDTTASSSNSVMLYGTPFSDNRIPLVTSDARGCSTTASSVNNFPNQVMAPLTSFPIRACPKGTIIVSATSIATKLKQAESTASAPIASSVTSSSTSVNQVLQSTATTSDSSSSNPSPAPSHATFKMVAAPINVVDSVAPSLVTPVKQFSSNEDSAADSSPPELTSDAPKTSDSRRVPGTFIIESFSPSSSTSASSPTAIVVRQARTVLPKPVIPKVPPRRADVIVPRDEEFATLISPAPSDTPPAAKVAAPPEKVFNGVLLPKSDKKEIRAKAYICHKKPASKSNYRSLLPKR